MRSCHHIYHSNKRYLVPVTNCYCCCYCQLIRHRNCTLILRFLNQYTHCPILAVTFISMIQQSSREVDRWRQKILFQRKVLNKCTACHCTAQSSSSQNSYIFLTSRYMPWLSDVQSSSSCNRGTTDHRPQIMMSSVQET
jgi:hypothetical protein